MKKIILSVSMVLLLISLGGCNKDKQNGQTDNIPTTQPAVSQPAAEPTQEPDQVQLDEQDTLTIKDYYPLQPDTVYVYAGEGNEFASYNTYTDFIDTDNNRIQTRAENGGTQSVRVIEIKDGKLAVIKSVGECYYRDNILETAEADNQAEVLLMEPLVKGTQWTLSNGRKRYISAAGVSVDTPSGKYQALEVTTEDKDTVTKDYYAPQVGLVKAIFISGASQITSTLSEIKTDTPFTQTIDIYYPDSDEKIYAKPITLSFRTGDITRQVMQAAICREAEKESYLKLASTNTKVNSLYLGSDNIAYIDFSPELVTEMNAGAGYEILILQCIANTIGNYYGTDRVYITVDGKPYESGHILMKKGETLKVDMSNVER